MGVYPGCGAKVISVTRAIGNQSLGAAAKLGLKRCRHYGRFSANLLAGSAFIQSCFAFPGVSRIEERHLNDYRLFRFWVRDLLHSTNTELVKTGEAMQAPGLFVCNHISWLDTIVLNHAQPLSFIARHDLKEWPFLGKFTQRMHSVYIDRTSKFKAYRALPVIVERIQRGRSVLVFPESTTSDGRDVLPFYPMFYEAAVRAQCLVQPIALRYTDEHGEQIVEPAFIDDDSFFDTLKRIYSVKRVFAHLHFLNPLDARTMHRKELCAESRKQIANALGNIPAR